MSRSYSSLDANPPFTAAWYESIRSQIGEAACQQLGFYVIPPETRLSVVIPIYNERATLLDLVERVRNVPLRKELILVDDGSTDGSREVLEALQKEPADPDNQIKVLYHRVNLGKGAALRSGFAEATGDLVLVQDADLEYNPIEYPRLIRPIVEGQADVVYGSRFRGDQPHRVLYYWHQLGNYFLTFLSNCFTNLNLTDMETCYKVFRRSVIQDIGPRLRESRFGIEPEITARVARGGYRVYEVAISYAGRTYAEGKKIDWRDGLSAIWCIVRYGLGD